MLSVLVTVFLLCGFAVIAGSVPLVVSVVYGVALVGAFAHLMVRSWDRGAERERDER